MFRKVNLCFLKRGIAAITEHGLLSTVASVYHVIHSSIFQLCFMYVGLPERPVKKADGTFPTFPVKNKIFYLIYACIY